VQPAADGLDAAGEPEGGQLGVQHGGVGDAGGEPSGQVLGVAVEPAGPVDGLDEQFVEAGGAGEATHGAAFQLELPADLGQRGTVGQQLLHCGVALAGAHDQLPFATAYVERPVRLSGRGCWFWVCGWFSVTGGLRPGTRNRAGGLGGFGGHRGPYAGVMRGDGLVHGFADVVPDVPSVGDLDCIWCTRTGPFRVGAGPVPADDLRPGMRLKPRGEGFGGAAGQHVDRSVSVHVQQHGAVDVATTQGEIVDAECSDRARLRQRRRTQQVEQGVPADGHAQLPGQPGAGPAGQGDSDRGQRGPQRRAVSGVRAGQAGDLFDERGPSAGGVVADQPSYQQPDHDRAPGEGGVGQPPVVAAVHPRRFGTAAGTGCPVSARAGLDHDPAVGLMDPIDRDLCQVRQQPLKIAPRSGTTVHTGQRSTRQHRPPQDHRQNPIT